MSPTKALNINQHIPLHDVYGQHDCCLCKAEQEIARLKAEIEKQNSLKCKEPIYYDCTLTLFADQMNVPLFKAMEFGKYFQQKHSDEVEKYVGDILDLIAEKKKLEKENGELKTVLSAWHDVFGTTQLTHAKDRLNVAEKTIADLRKGKGVRE